MKFDMESYTSNFYDMEVENQINGPYYKDEGRTPG